MPFKLISDLNPDQPIDHAERGLHYGDGIFETMRLTDGEIPLWPQHYQRLRQSAARLSIPCPEQDWLDEQLEAYRQLQQDLVIKLILTRGSGGRGLTLPEPLNPSVLLFKYPYKNQLNQSIKAYISEITLPKNPNLAGLKHLNRLDYVLATEALARHEDYAEALLMNTDGHLVESIVHNVFFVLDQVICTPDLNDCGVDGVMRQLLLKSLIETGKTVRIDNFDKQDILAASECFLCNSVQGIRPLIRLEQQEYPIGPITEELQRLFNATHH